MDACSIIEQVEELYCRCNTYHDRGVSLATFNDGEKRSTFSFEFETNFARPRQFRFDWRSIEQANAYPSGTSCVICVAEPTTFYKLHGQRNRRIAKGLRNLVNAASQLSGGTANIVVSLLLPEEISRIPPVIRCEPAKSLSEEELDGDLCYHLSDQRTDMLCELWVSKTFVIRKYKESFSVSADSLATDYALDSSALELSAPLATNLSCESEWSFTSVELNTELACKAFVP